MHDCLESGHGIDEGGARYNYTEPNFLGFASVIDSLRVLRELVFSGEYRMADFLEILESDFAGNEVLRQRIINRIPHFGTNEQSTDDLAAAFADMLVRCCDGISNFRGVKPLIPGVQGREIKGPTAALLSSTAWKQIDYLGGVAINIKFAKGQMSGENEDKMLAFIKVFLERGGYQMQLNCIDNEVLLAAQKDPEKYADLLVRVGGFSAYFCKLPPLMQQEIIDRDVHSF